MTNRPSPELDAFEQRLLAELRIVVDAQADAASSALPVPARQRARRSWYVPVAGAAAVVVAVALGVTAVRPQAGTARK